LPFLAQLEPGDPFPPSSAALAEPGGLLAVGGALDVETLLRAYRRGIFPWYEAPQPILWWTPDPRSVLFPDELHVSRSLRRTLRRGQFRLSVDRDFTAVMEACAAPRAGQPGTWIGAGMLRAYRQLHEHGYAHSIEVRDEQGALAGGLYGVALGRAFFGESMFSRATDASKVALVALVNCLRRGGGEIIDCQVQNAHLDSIGARDIPRVDFEERLAQTVDRPMGADTWSLPEECGALL
jgi:leucyl/phenylalanyl-tRNA--protein transferase